MENNKDTKGVSRRKFLRNAGLAVGGAAAFGLSGISLTGCSVSPECQTSTDKTKADEQNIEYFGECICPNCGASQPHPRGVPCRLLTCPECGQGMGRAAA
jgi:hypothetical protein